MPALLGPPSKMAKETEESDCAEWFCSPFPSAAQILGRTSKSAGGGEGLRVRKFPHKGGNKGTERKKMADWIVMG